MAYDVERLVLIGTFSEERVYELFKECGVELPPKLEVGEVFETEDYRITRIN